MPSVDLDLGLGLDFDLDFDLGFDLDSDLTDHRLIDRILRFTLLVSIDPCISFSLHLLLLQYTSSR